MQQVQLICFECDRLIDSLNFDFADRNNNPIERICPHCNIKVSFYIQENGMVITETEDR